MARGDPDGVGVPELWELDLTSPTIHRVEDEPDTSDGEEPEEPGD